MDMRTRIERKMDKLMAQKRKNWEIEADLKVPIEVPMELDESEQTEPQTSTKISEIEKRKSNTKTNVRRKQTESKRPPRVQMSRSKETQTLLQRKGEFLVIGSGRPSLKADSAGHKLDTCYYTRTEKRIKLMNALTTGDIPSGALNAMSIATRIEAVIFRVLSQDAGEYNLYCDQCSTFIALKCNQKIRHDLIMGRLDAEDFAFIPSKSSDLQDFIGMRIKWKKVEEKEKIKQLKKGIV